MEIAEARYWSPNAFESLTPARLARRLHLAVAAATDGMPVYAEHGVAASEVPPPVPTP